MLLRELTLDEWVCGNCYAEPCQCSVDEGATPIFGKTGNKVVRKYRCTSGSRKGRIVAKPTTCSAAKNMKASNTMKKTRRSKGATVNIKANRTKRTSPASQKLTRLNVGSRRRLTPKKRRGAKGKR
tara:strand:- start:1035 stop:1412 length:378 start_codon:yes stop_codon:yes gene_type:complete